MTKFKEIFSNENLLGKKEKDIQNFMSDFFEEMTGMNIIEEGLKNIPQFEGHGVLIIEDLKKGLKHSNTNIINKTIKKYPKLNESIILDAIFTDFVTKFDRTKTNAEKYNLIYSLDEKQIDIPYKNENVSLKYTVLDHNYPEKNIFKIVKEKRIKVNTEKHFEYPDFAIYFNGIPFAAIEVKTLTAGLNQAFKDAREKPGYYKNFLFTIGTTGTEAFIMADRNHKSMYLFKDYDNNGENSGNGFIDIAMELIVKPKNLLFYSEFGTLKQQDRNGDFYLVNSRVQQYYALKKIVVELKRVENNDKKLLAYLKHHTRTGKTITFKLIMSKVMTSYIKRFETIYFFTHDLTVLRTILSEMQHFEFGNKKLELIESINDYKNNVKNKRKGIFLVNMQKIEKFEKIVNDSVKILILIDEIHTFQTGQLAEIRKKQFPNASYIGATATPNLTEYTNEQLEFIFYQEKEYKPNSKELEEYKLKVKKDITEENYGKQLDNFTASDAIDLKLVTPLSINSTNWDIKMQTSYERLELSMNETLLKELNSIKNSLVRELEDEVNDNSEETVEILNTFKSMDVTEIENNSANHNLLARIKRKIEKKRQKLKFKLKKEERRTFSRYIFEDKINFITDEMKTLKDSINEYKPSFFWVVNDISEAMATLRLIKELGSDEQQNIYNRFRFAVDVSELGETSIHDDDREYYSNLYPEGYDLDKVNGKYVKKEMIDDFESQEEGSIDCLILVSKRLMGYDNKELTGVFLDKEIRDIKLIMQFVTRPTTIRNGKQCGYIFDLSFKRKGQDLSENLKVLKMAFELYDSEKRASIIFTKEFLDKIYLQLNIKLVELKNFFKENNLDEESFFEFKNLYSQKLISLYQEEKTKKKTLLNPFFSLLKDINNDLKQVINPFYQLKKDNEEKLLNEIIGLLDMTTILNKVILNDQLINEKDYVYYTDRDIRILSREIFETLGKDLDEEMESINDVMEASLIGKKEEELKSFAITKIQTKAQQDLLNIKENIGLRKTKVFEYFDDISRLSTIEEIEESYQKAEDLLLEEQAKINETIKNDYENNIDWYIVDQSFDFDKKISKYFAEKIREELDKINVEIDEYQIKNILDDRIDVKSIEFLNDIFSEDEIDSFDFKSLQNELEKDKFVEVIENIVNQKDIYFIKD